MGSRQSSLSETLALLQEDSGTPGQAVHALQTLPEFLYFKLQSFAFLEAFIEHDGAGNFVDFIRPAMSYSVIRQQAHNLVSGISLATLSEQRGVPLQQHLQVLVSGTWPNLVSLDLSGLDLTARSSFGLSSSIAQLREGQWPALRVLNLSRTQLDHDAIHSLTEVKLQKLETLDLSWNWLEDSAALQLPMAKWPELQHLSLRFNLLHTTAVAALSTSSWPMLKSLNLRNNFIDGEATAQLTKGQWPMLEHLDLRINRSPDISQLREGLWPQLKTLAVDSKVLGSEGVSWLLEKWPGLMIETRQQAVIDDQM